MTEPLTLQTEELTESTRASVNADLERLTEGARRWSETRLIERAELLERTRDSVSAHAASWAQAAMAAKGTPSHYAGEEWLSGPYAVISNLNVLARSLRALARGDSPAAALRIRPAPGDRVAAQVLPVDVAEGLLLNGFRAEVWSEPGIDAKRFCADAGLGAAHPGENGGVGLVLGAGNISSIGPQDVLYELVAFNRASLLKLNPTFATLAPVLGAALAPLVEAGLLAIVEGGAEVGAYLTGHAGIAHVHITGSEITHDLIVWGAGEESQERRAANTPKLTTPITSELGGVAPVIVVPSEFSDADLRFQAENVATMRLHNGGHNCIAAQALILSADWPQREAFLDALRDVFDHAPPRKSWYPGTERKLSLAESAYPDAEHHRLGLLIDAPADGPADLFETEYFGPVLGHTALPGEGQAFLDAAVSFANDRLEGTLGANVIIAPGQRRALGAGFDAAIARLAYGTIAINAWTALGFLTAGAAWGAFPGQTLQEVGSGIGVVHNAFLLDHVERTVINGPFRPAPRSLLAGELTLSPKPPWFITARTGASTGRRLTEWAAHRGVQHLPGIALSALAG